MKKFMFSNTVNHILVWIAYFYISWSFYSEYLPLKGITVSPLRTFVFNVVYIGTFIPIPYVVIYLKRTVFNKGRYLLFFLLVILLFVLSSCFFAGIDKLFLLQHEPFWFFSIGHLLSRMPYLIILSLIINWIQLRADYHKQKKQQLELEKLKNEAELNMLKAQISPHFLFNALNNLNSLIHINREKASDVVVILSDLLRYVIYDGKKEAVSIQQEVQYIENYLMLTSMKKRLDGKIVFEKKIQDDVTITPLIFINFIENAIKHGSLERPDDTLEIQLKAQKTEIEFVCKNTINNDVSKDESKGIGIENVTARLHAVYPQKHTLAIVHGETYFDVQLKIQLS